MVKDREYVSEGPVRFSTVQFSEVKLKKSIKTRIIQNLNCLNQRQTETVSTSVQSHCVSANQGNVVLARPRTFVECILLLSSNVKTKLQGLHFFNV